MFTRQARPSWGVAQLGAWASPGRVGLQSGERGPGERAAPSPLPAQRQGQAHARASRGGSCRSLGPAQPVVPWPLLGYGPPCSLSWRGLSLELRDPAGGGLILHTCVEKASHEVRTKSWGSCLWKAACHTPIPAHPRKTASFSRTNSRCFMESISLWKNQFTGKDPQPRHFFLSGKTYSIKWSSEEHTVVHSLTVILRKLDLFASNLPFSPKNDAQQIIIVVTVYWVFIFIFLLNMEVYLYVREIVTRNRSCLRFTRDHF